VRWADGFNTDTGEEQYVNIIAQILLFYSHPVDHTIHALIHSVDWDKQVSHGVYGTYWDMEMEGEFPNCRPRIWSVPVDCLERHAMMIRYRENDDYKWIHIWDQATWPECFQTIEFQE
jgi:hypothetical protein